MDSQRLDKWLWHARILKTRSRAQKLVSAGHVRVDGERTTSASQKLREGQVLTITLPREIKILKILGFSERRGAYEMARQLYEDLSPPQTAKSKMHQSETVKEGMIVTGRPSQQDRRMAIRLKQKTIE